MYCNGYWEDRVLKTLDNAEAVRFANIFQQPKKYRFDIEKW